MNTRQRECRIHDGGRDRQTSCPLEARRECSCDEERDSGLAQNARSGRLVNHLAIDVLVETLEMRDVEFADGFDREGNRVTIGAVGSTLS